MKLNDEELELLVEALAVLNIKSYGPTKRIEVIELENKLRKQLSKHDWRLDGQPGMYDNNYICRKCGKADSESSDSSYTKPEFGCSGKKQSRIDIVGQNGNNGEHYDK